MLYKDFMVSQEKFALKPDKSIPGLLQTTPPPPSPDLHKYYDSDAYLSHADEINNIFDWLYFRVKKYNLRHKLKLIAKNSSGKKILDYGCGTGELVNYLNQNNFDAYGFEPNTKANTIARKNNSNRIYIDNDFLDDTKFDVITLWHVLEHIPNYQEVLQKLKDALSENGKLFIALPNYKSYDAQFYKNYWAAYDVPRHLWHFDQESVENILGQFGMIIETRYPMLFDAFYVSMLSEKYKRNRLGFIRAMAIGLISNCKAYKSGEYSSIIYQVKKK